jgi:hypothetical protein
MVPEFFEINIDGPPSQQRITLSQLFVTSSQHQVTENLSQEIDIFLEFYQLAEYRLYLKVNANGINSVECMQWLLSSIDLSEIR